MWHCLRFILVLVGRVIWPGANTVRVVTWVFGVTGGSEVLQRWHSVWLESVRSTTLGSMLLGIASDPLDFLHYAIGAGLGMMLLR